MSRLPWLIAALALAAQATAQPLSDSDRQLLLERLNSIKDAAEGRVGGRIATALAAFREAMASNEAALALYVKCIEKLDFEDQKRSSQDFREWKRRQKDQLAEPGLQLALRHQLHWLVLTLEVASDPDCLPKMGPRVIAALDSIFSNAEHLAGQQGILRQAVTSSVFARAYNVSNIKVEDWPTEPLALASVYGTVILPPLRQAGDVEQLRTAWLNRIRQEALIREAWSGGGGPRGGPRNDDRNEGGRTPAFEKFLTDERPNLLWQMEEDLFRAGDQRNAALRMLEHLERYVSHPQAASWTDRFIQLITPPTPAAPDPADVDPAGVDPAAGL